MHIYKRYDSEHRLLSAPLLFFELEEEIAQLKQDVEWHTRHRNAVTLVKELHLSVVLVVLQKGKTLLEHMAQGPATVQLLQGSVRVRTGNETRVMKGHALVALGSGIVHQVEALEESALLVTIAEPKASTSGAAEFVSHVVE